MKVFMCSHTEPTTVSIHTNGMEYDFNSQHNSDITQINN